MPRSQLVFATINQRVLESGHLSQLFAAFAIGNEYALVEMKVDPANEKPPRVALMTHDKGYAPQEFNMLITFHQLATGLIPSSYPFVDEAAAKDFIYYMDKQMSMERSNG
jgi:hypothetical protein